MERPGTSHVFSEKGSLSALWRPRTAVAVQHDFDTALYKKQNKIASAWALGSIHDNSSGSRSASQGEETCERLDFDLPRIPRKSFSGLGTAFEEVRSLGRSASKRPGRLSGLFKHKSRESLSAICQEQGQQPAHHRSPSWFARATNAAFKRGRQATFEALAAENDSAVLSSTRGLSIGDQVAERSLSPRPGDAARAAAAASKEIIENSRSLFPKEIAKLKEIKIANDSESGIGFDMRDAVEDSGCADSSLTRRDPSELPAELFFHIVTFLDAPSVMNAELVSRRWYETASSYSVWRNIFGSEFDRRASLSQETASVGGLGLGKGKKQPLQEWKKMWKVRKTLDARWRDGHAAAIYLEGHTDSVYCAQFDEEKIITGSRDRTIRVWDLKSLECIKVIGLPKVGGISSLNAIGSRMTRQRPFASVSTPLPANQLQPLRSRINHHGSILCLQFDSTTMVTGSSDCTLIIWDLMQDYKAVKRLRAHRAGVLDVCFDKSHIVSCSKDATISLWSRSSGDLLRTLTGHRGPVNAIQLRGEHVVSASGDGIAKLWNLTTGTCVKEFRSKDRGLACVEFSPDSRIILAGGNDHVIYQFDANTGEMVRLLDGHANLVRSLYLDSLNGRVISGSYDYSVKAFSVDDGTLLCDFVGWTTSWMLSAKADYRRIVATSQDGRAVIMDFGYALDGVELLEG